jgi:EAL domain-containing protein (putative c-di-GMP-specific phosphodiesterase class I)
MTIERDAAQPFAHPSDRARGREDGSMNASSKRNARVAAVLSQKEIRRALDADEFVLHFQPIVDLASGRARGVEALIRWEHPVSGLLAPDSFLPAVAQTPVMTSITRWVLQDACAAAGRWPDWTISVNITARDLAGDTLERDVLDALSGAGLAPEQLTLELTETALVQDMSRAATTLGRLREHGVGIALDDFGTGYSSMLYLRELPVTSVKIDRVFISGLSRDGDDLAIVTSLLTLARTVGLTAVAEGVETAAQARQLHSLGCPLGQGYLWTRPLRGMDADRIHRNGLPTPVGTPGLTRQQYWRASNDRLVKRAQQLLSEGASMSTIAAALNTAGERTERGHRWHAASVARLINASLQAMDPKP